MRITFIAPTLNMAGGTKVIVVYAQQLMRRGHRVLIVSPPPPSISIYQKLKSWMRGRGWPRRSTEYSSYVERSGVDHHVLDRYRAVTDQDVPDGDVIIATWWETAEWVNALNRSKGAKVYFVQGHEVFAHLPVARCKATYQLPLHKVVVAPWLKEVMRTEYGDAKVDIVPNSVDRSQFFAPVRGKQPYPTIGFLYSTAALKGLDVTFRALAIVRERYSNLQTISFGSDPPHPGLQLPHNTEYSFCPPQELIRNIYSRCDVWITASRTEGFNLTALEAMACRTPVVATRTGWPQEAIKQGWNGMLVDIDDATGAAGAIAHILALNDDGWRQLSANAYSTTTSGSWEESAAMFENALRRACRRAGRGEILGTCNCVS